MPAITTDPFSLTQARCSAIEYLARRDHASFELRNKLTRKGFEENVINHVLIQLQADNLLCDERFAENYVHVRTHKGYGPLRIHQELQKRGIGKEIIIDVLETDDILWKKRARQARQKRFGGSLPQNRREFAKQARFLQNRGFADYHIKSALSAEVEE
jgi:regulatory protein